MPSVTNSPAAEPLAAVFPALSACARPAPAAPFRAPAPCEAAAEGGKLAALEATLELDSPAATATASPQQPCRAAVVRKTAAPGAFVKGARPRVAFRGGPGGSEPCASPLAHFRLAGRRGRVAGPVSGADLAGPNLARVRAVAPELRSHARVVPPAPLHLRYRAAGPWSAEVRAGTTRPPRRQRAQTRPPAGAGSAGTAPLACSGARPSAAPSPTGAPAPPVSRATPPLTRAPPPPVQEDALLKALICKHGARNWSVIAHGIHGRSGKSCRLRWCNQLNPCVKKEPFSEDEDAKIIAVRNTPTRKEALAHAPWHTMSDQAASCPQAHKEHGNKWAIIARSLVGRCVYPRPP